MSQKDEQLEDLRAAYLLLGGTEVLDKKGLPTRRYLTAKEEVPARRALVRLLRSPEPLDSLVRRMLAALFDPEPTSDFF
jgi:hypothetical protein